MRIRITERFRRAFAELEDADADRVEKALRQLTEDPRHPGLRVKKIQGAERIWEARVSRSLRLTFEFQDDWIVLRNVGAHDRTLKNP
jgi:mRNA-degrading endonuclease RelE of RelBE toxin-antitoxin system